MGRGAATSVAPTRNSAEDLGNTSQPSFTEPSTSSQAEWISIYQHGAKFCRWKSLHPVESEGGQLVQPWKWRGLGSMPSSATSLLLQPHYYKVVLLFVLQVTPTLCEMRAMKDLEVVCQKYYFVNWRSHGNIKLQHSFHHKTNLSQLLPLKQLRCRLKVDFSTRIEVHWRSH